MWCNIYIEQNLFKHVPTLHVICLCILCVCVVSGGGGATLIVNAVLTQGAVEQGVNKETNYTFQLASSWNSMILMKPPIRIPGKSKETWKTTPLFKYFTTSYKNFNTTRIQMECKPEARSDILVVKTNGCLGNVHYSSGINEIRRV